MFDVIGKRQFFYALSLALTIPGLVFILLTPFTDAGLQFTIDYTGGTRWEIKFEDPNVTPEQVAEVFADNGLEASTVRTSTGFIEIKTEPIGLQPAPAPAASPDPSASASAGASASPAASGSPAPSASASASAVRLGLGRAVGPRPSAPPAARQHRPADRRSARGDGHRARGGARPDRGPGDR